LSEKDVNLVSKFSVNTKTLKEIDEAVIEATQSIESEELVTPIGGTPPRQDAAFTTYAQNTRSTKRKTVDLKRISDNEII
jgi:hypothetical protein